MNDTLIRQWLLNNSSYIANNNIITDALHALGWLIVKLLRSLTDACESLYQIVFQLIDFTTWNSLEDFLDQFRYAFTAFLTLAIFALGIMLIFNHEKKPKIIINLCLAAFILCGSTAVLSGINSSLKAWNNALLDSQSSSSSELIRGSLIDWLYIDGNSSIASITPDNIKSYIYPSISGTDIDMIDINATIDYDDDALSADAKSVFSKKLLYIYGSEGKLTDVSNGILGTGVFNEFYYRYHVDFFTLYLKLFALLIVYLCMAYKVVRLIIEIVQARVVAVLYAADMTSHQKTVRILCSIRDSYFILLLITVFVKVYILAQLYIDSEINANPLVKAIMTLFLAFAIIDGPNFIQQLTGVDAGLQSGFGKLYAAVKTSEMITSMVSRAGHTAAHTGHSIFHSSDQSHTTNKEASSPIMDDSQQNGTNPNVHTATKENGTRNINNQEAGATYENKSENSSTDKNADTSSINLHTQKENSTNIDHTEQTATDLNSDSNSPMNNESILSDLDSRQPIQHPEEDNPLHAFNPAESSSTENSTFEKMEADLHTINSNEVYGTSGLEKENIVSYKNTTKNHPTIDHDKPNYPGKEINHE